MRELKLTPRLAAVAELVPGGARFADVGTDHAYLPVWLLQQGRIDRAIATDLRTGPLSRARVTAERYGMTERMSFRLCDGLSGVGPDEVDTIAIAGMGGETIAQILAAAPWLQGSGCRLLLQPMSSLPDLRLWLSEHGFSIEKETVAREGESLYLIMTVNCHPGMPLTLEEQWLGREDESNPLREEYLEMLRGRCGKMLHGLTQSGKPEDEQRRKVLERICGALAQRKERRGFLNGNGA